MLALDFESSHKLLCVIVMRQYVTRRRLGKLMQRKCAELPLLTCPRQSVREHF